jgi:MoaA/NifB/PqqE/SkfB family radical SAM enzyme
MPLEKIKAMCKVLVDKYNNNSVDIEGGEPTIFKDSVEMVRYCAEIGLKPSLITNALVLDNIEKLKEYKDAGLYDFLISVHALGTDYDNLVQVPGAHKRQMKAIDNMIELEIPFRFNAVMTQDVLPHLKNLGKLAVEKGARAVNFITYNPFIDQSEGRTTVVPSFTEIMKKLTPVIDYLEENDIEVNLRYFPFCVVEERHRKNIQDFQQRNYDLHEWECAGETWTSAPIQRNITSALDKPFNMIELLNNWRKSYIADNCKDKPNICSEEFIKKIQKRTEKGSLKIVLFGHPDKNLEIAEILREKCPKCEIVAFGSSKKYVKTDSVHGYPLKDEDWIAQNKPEMIVVTTENYKDDIMKVLKAKKLDSLVVFSFLDENYDKYAYKKDFEYIREFKPIEDFSELEYQYKEHRMLCSKLYNYYKKGKCESCSLYGICDGFHGDYVAMKGYGEISPLKLGKDIIDPRYYMFDQMKVVEDQEASWALPKGLK